MLLLVDNDRYLHELTTFPKGRFDDQCDSTSQALDWIKRGGSFDQLLRTYKAMKEKVESGLYGDQPEEPVRFAGAERRLPTGMKCAVSIAASAGIERYGAMPK